MPQAVTQAEFDEKVRNAKGLVMVDFWAAWCPPCRALAPILEKLDDERDDVTVLKLDVDSNQELSMKEGVQGIPTVKIYKDGVEVKALVGLMPKSEYEKYLDQA